MYPLEVKEIQNSLVKLKIPDDQANIADKPPDKPQHYHKMNDLILISAERLKELEKLESKLPNMIETAIIDYKKEKLKKLHEKDKLDPAAVNLRVKRYALKHKDEINAKRRLKREEKKAAAAKTETSGTKTVTTNTTTTTTATTATTSTTARAVIQATATTSTTARAVIQATAENTITDSSQTKTSYTNRITPSPLCDAIHDLTVRFDD